MNESIERILIIRPSALGDVAKTVPCLASLRARFPEARIDWLVRDSFADVIRHHPMVNGVIEFPRSRFRAFWRSLSVYAEMRRWLGELRRENYQCVYDLQGLFRSGYFSWWTGARRRVGLADAKEMGWLFYTNRVKVPPRQHAVERMLAVLEGDGVPVVRDSRLYVGAEDAAKAAQWRQESGLDGRPYMVLAPTAMWLSKRWPAQRHAEVAAKLASEGIEDFVVVGAPGEQGQIKPLLEAWSTLRGPRLHDRVGKTSVGELMAILAWARAALCNDSATLHIALGLGVRVLGLYGPTDRHLVGPYGYPLGILEADGERAAHYRAAKQDQEVISRIPASAVVERLRDILKAPAPDPAHGIQQGGG